MNVRARRIMNQHIINALTNGTKSYLCSLGYTSCTPLSMKVSSRLPCDRCSHRLDMECVPSRAFIGFIPQRSSSWYEPISSKELAHLGANYGFLTNQSKEACGKSNKD